MVQNSRFLEHFGTLDECFHEFKKPKLLYWLIRIYGKYKVFFNTKNKEKENHPLLLALAHRGSTAYVPLSVSLHPTQWDNNKQRIKNHPNQLLLNVYINNMKQRVDTYLLNLLNEDRLRTMTTTEVRTAVLDHLHPERVQERARIKRKETSFAFRFLLFAESKKKSTRIIYMHTYKRIEVFEGKRLDSLTFEDITQEWLNRFDEFMSITSPSKNARNIHFRNIRAFSIVQ